MKMVVMELMRWNAPAVLMLLVVLLTANSRIPQSMDVGFCEFFAGDGQISLALWSCGVKGSSHDIRYSNLMDLCSPHGFAFLDCNLKHHAAAVVVEYGDRAIAKVGNQRGVEHNSWCLLHVWHLLQLLLQNATWPEYIYIYTHLMLVQGLILMYTASRYKISRF